jgi:hypothetical protein
MTEEDRETLRKAGPFQVWQEDRHQVVCPKGDVNERLAAAIERVLNEMAGS